MRESISRASQMPESVWVSLNYAKKNFKIAFLCETMTSFATCSHMIMTMIKNKMHEPRDMLSEAKHIVRDSTEMKKKVEGCGQRPSRYMLKKNKWWMKHHKVMINEESNAIFGQDTQKGKIPRRYRSPYAHSLGEWAEGQPPIVGFAASTHAYNIYVKHNDARWMPKKRRRAPRDTPPWRTPHITPSLHIKTSAFSSNETCFPQWRHMTQQRGPKMLVSAEKNMMIISWHTIMSDKKKRY